MEFLQNLLDNSNTPILSAFLLGLMTAISPCPLATNITAVGYIGKSIGNKHVIFMNGLLYTAGRAISYSLLGLILYFGASKFHVARIFQTYGEKLLGPLLVIIGLLMLDLWHIPWPALKGFNLFTAREGKKMRGWDALLLGIVFALAFCPYSGVLYFGMLIPMTISSPSGLYLPLIFAIGTGILVIITAWLLAYSVSGIGAFYNRIKTFEKWFRIFVAVLFIIVGLYYSFNYFFS